jgi:hypothetical protein
MVRALVNDIDLAQSTAPTLQLRTELSSYISTLRGAHSMLVVTTAVSTFDGQARTQLKACGVRPIGRP